ncbi:MAG: NAD(P)-dependent oxidoreductase [Verrucomicrobiales bacterium]|nr:NAD(P)-dependent oxidoreductase [Verrucomicrobiales bacterium]
MRVLLTGASGFVGSHLWDGLTAPDCEVTLLLRNPDNRHRATQSSPGLRVVRGGLADGGALREALEEVTHVLHCAGATKALRPAGLMAANQQGTRNLVQAVNERRDRIERFVLISSLAAGHPATSVSPAREDDPSDPQSAYGRSKLAAESEVREGCLVPWTILRPAAVYGPRDTEFLPLFQAAARGLAPVFGGGKQELSLVHVKDLAETTLTALTHPDARGDTINVASPEIVTARDLALGIGAALGTRPRPVSLPWWLLESVCMAQTVWSRCTGRPTILGNGKFRELSAPGWVADTTRLRERLGDLCRTPLEAGLQQTAAWYRKEGRLKPGSADSRAKQA